MNKASQGSSVSPRLTTLRRHSQTLRIRGEPKDGPAVNSQLFSLPDEAVVGRADAESASAPAQAQDLGIRAAGAKKKPPYPAGDRRSERLVDEDPAAAFDVFERKDRAVRQQADRQPLTVCDPLEAQVVDVRRCECD